MTTIGNLLLSNKILINYDEDAKRKITEFYVANDESVVLPETLDADGALAFTVIDKTGKSYEYRAVFKDVSLYASGSSNR